MKKLTKLLALLLTVMLVLPAASALADTSWPEKTLKIIVP